MLGGGNMSWRMVTGAEIQTWKILFSLKTEPLFISPHHAQELTVYKENTPWIVADDITAFIFYISKLNQPIII